MLLAVTLPLGVEIYDLSKSATEATATITVADEGLIAATAFAGTVIEAAVDPSQVLAINATLQSLQHAPSPCTGACAAAA